MVHYPICCKFLDACRCGNSGQDEDIPSLRGAQFALAFDTGVQSEPKTRLETDSGGDTAEPVHLQVAQRQQVDNAAWRIEHLADAICELLDWQDRVRASKAERKARAMRACAANRQKRNRVEGPDAGVVDVSPAERLRRFLANCGKPVDASVAAQVHDASCTD